MLLPPFSAAGAQSQFRSLQSRDEHRMHATAPFEILPYVLHPAVFVELSRGSRTPFRRANASDEIHVHESLRQELRHSLCIRNNRSAGGLLSSPLCPEGRPPLGTGSLSNR